MASLRKGKPGCDNEKWTYVCPNARYWTSWHPGWKWHALVGNLLGLSLLEVVDDALTEVERLGFLRDASSALQELKKLEDREYKTFTSSEPTKFYDEMIREGVENLNGLNLKSLLYTRRPYCHTAGLPAETRFTRIPTESSKLGFFHYDKVVSTRQSESVAINSTRIRLAYKEQERQDCELLLQVD
jgi:hypothetical protein